MEKTDIKTSPPKLASGVECIDAAMGGGLGVGVITEIFGEGGTGKTNLAMIFAVAASSAGKSAFYIDSEGLSVERLKQIYRGQPEDLESLIIFRVSSLDDQETAIQKAAKMLEKIKNPG